MATPEPSPILDKGDIIPSSNAVIHSTILRPTNAETLLHNARIKVYPDGSIKEVMIASRPIFNPSHAERLFDDVKQKGLTMKLAIERDLSEAWDREHASAALGDRWEAEKNAGKAASLSRARRRARTAVFDLAFCNRFDLFVTLTVAPEKADRYSYRDVLRTLNAWLSNRVQRKGLKYVLVPEHHKDGAVHFHALCNDVLARVDSGHRDKHRRRIYNLPEWPLGWTTAVRLTGTYEAVCRYICKYINKADEKVGGRWYLSGGDLARPAYLYCDMPLNAVSGKYLEIPEAALTLNIVDGENLDIAAIGQFSAYRPYL